MKKEILRTKEQSIWKKGSSGAFQTIFIRSNSRKVSHLDNPLGKVWSYNLNKIDIEINLMQEFFITKYKLTRPC